MNSLEDIHNGIQIHLDINAIYYRLKVCDCINQMKNDWKGSELSAKRMGKVLHKVFKAVLDYLNNSFPTLAESGS